MISSSFHELSLTYDRLQGQGVVISSDGVAVKTSSHYTRERYLDDTQRQFINFGKKAASASSVNRRGSTDTVGTASPTPSRQNSVSSVHELESASGRKLRSGRTT